LRATGHCPHLSHPVETIAAIRSFLAAHTSLRDSAR
jgi:pimeloyl-ACP methyl ester carboxylesterase